ncbi:bifunctional adenosylcobinamide kinase/adenosylcobinamide-phosphate guanylyltransferase [Roseomonas marmotae]|uniref:Bifunctional adenosylcobalamin biosynthesis protein n=1 Tax=Roseomonas marmotae TaxID=2768161 RepID=A0ABS3KCG2_9PROT|nr:bifunctional adenosylcobinamide kinase/adenosylcobinamide-phosphate guanylyltransferase [Roseomonas marmotae]MBO1075163.1 bifunctional adenosylcobinamide kinase/adenosylcobinamide-phosphate guanylyltransferase [Roseomonas marmotae]QTI79727.1 bifunctional adenosylcobinamide kinase/adenosylcobinamide-phosphate guanylyltransferase [Roseomonas marmotae]
MSITLVLGGARSGKSRHAEALVARHPAPWVYLATAEAWDEEMRARIAEHRARRGPEWQTVDAPLGLPVALAAAGARPVLVDCLTLWLTNLMLGGRDVEAATAALEAVLAARAAPTVLVANEVGLGIVPETPLGRAFRDKAGVLNQRIAARAQHVHFIAAGLPLLLKGELP